MNYLLITLGHNSSAIFVDTESSRVIGYEQERLSGIKADSQFPIDAINEIRMHVGEEKFVGCSVFISHWFNSDVKRLINNKYMTKENFMYLISFAKSVTMTSSSFTHHDAHAYSVMAFREYFEKHNAKQLQIVDDPVYTIVADGFGTDAEVLSIYRKEKLIHRVYGYGASLGLMYQYATSAVGMKENQDEYKFLGYEAHIDEYLDETGIDVLDHSVSNLVEFFITQVNESTSKITLDKANIIDFSSLESVKKFWHSKFNDIILPFEKTIFNSLNADDRLFAKRCIVAYVVQNTVENVLLNIVRKFKMNNINVAGGLFYNVKLNNAILESTNGTFCAMPLAGDQGAAIGMFHALTEYSFNFGDLCFGERRMYNMEKAASEGKEIYCYPVKFTDDTAKSVVAHKIAKAIADGRIVNLVEGNMEFGPRALCHTSTLFLPTAKNAADNNHMNNRNEVMPCAPVCTKANAEMLFSKKELSRVIGSDGYMICTHDYTGLEYTKSFAGVMHKRPLEEYTYTGRPQIVSDKSSLIYKVLEFVEKFTGAKCIVNTSFNAHGRPIAFDMTSILQNYEYQREHARHDAKPMLFIIK